MPVSTTPAAIKEKKTFFGSLVKKEESFFANLSLSLKENGFLVSEDGALKIYTVSCQLFHRLWWNESKNRNKRYENSRQGKSYYDLFSSYRKLRGFPPCLSGMVETLRHRLIIKAHETCELLEIHSDALLTEAAGMIGEELLKDLESISGVVSLMTKIKSGNCGKDKRVEKDRLKKDSVTTITAAAIWANLVEDFIAEPLKLVRF